MIGLDTNLLVYAHREELPFHAKALECLRVLAEGKQAWAIPWPCVHEFLATVTHRRIFNPPTPMNLALDAVDAWMQSPTLVLLHEQPQHWAELRRTVTAGQVVGPMVHDARIAALCVQHGVSEFWSADRDYSRFPSLRLRNPLINS